MDITSSLLGLAGGAMIGLAAVLAMGLFGRTTGVSGILGGVFDDPTDIAWRLEFLAGLAVGPLAYVAIAGAMPQVEIAASLPLLVLGGLMVGIGTQLSTGCTSGHGVCGVARGARRSIVATATFMAAAMATVFLIRQVLGV